MNGSVDGLVEGGGVNWWLDGWVGGMNGRLNLVGWLMEVGGNGWFGG